MTVRRRGSGETGIAGKIESGRSVLEHIGVDTLDESVVIEVVNGSGRTGHDIRNSLGKVRIPPYAEVRSQSWRQLPRVGRIEIHVELVCLMLVGLALEESKQFSRQEVRQPRTGH